MNLQHTKPEIVSQSTARPIIKLLSRWALAEMCPRSPLWAAAAALAWSVFLGPEWWLTTLLIGKCLWQRGEWGACSQHNICVCLQEPDRTAEIYVTSPTVFLEESWALNTTVSFTFDNCFKSLDNSGILLYFVTFFLLEKSCKKHSYYTKVTQLL